MRITFVLPYPGVSGGIRVIAMHALRLQERGHKVTILSSPWVPWSRRDRALALMRRWLQRIAPQFDGLANPSHLDGLPLDHRRIPELRPVVNSDVPDGDIVIATWWETAEWVSRLSPRKGCKVYFIQGYETESGAPIERLRGTWRLPMHKIVVARWLAEFAASEFGDLDVSLVPNSVDRALFHAPPRGKQRIATVGTLYSPSFMKGCDVCLAAHRVARRGLGDLRLIAFGQEKRRDTRLPPEAIYYYAPRQEALRQIYASCDAWLFGSRREGFGLPVLEAMACRTPVIATPAGAAPDILADGGGVLVRHEDAEEMADEIQRIVTMPESQWQGLSSKALENASRYSWDDACDAFEAALHRAIEKAGSRELTAMPQIA